MLNAPRRPIGVFDSGTGGLSVLRALRAALPREDFVYVDDSGHGPYGERGDDHVIGRSLAVAAQLHLQGAKALVVACNTATAAAVELLRSQHPQWPVIGVEPALKPAVATSRTRHIGVLATRGTLTSPRFTRLQALVGGDVHFVLQPCDGLAAAIDALAWQAPGQASGAVESLCRNYLDAMGSFGAQPGAMDTLVLGCTHYVLVQPLLQRLVGADVQLVATGEAVARQTAHRLGLRTAADPAGLADAGGLTLLTTGDPLRLDQAARHWLGPVGAWTPAEPLLSAQDPPSAAP